MSAKLPKARENGFRLAFESGCKPFVFSVPFWYLGCSNSTCLACNLGVVVRAEMRKLFTIVAILGLATGLAALTARADGTTVTYAVDGTFSADPVFSSTSLSNPGDNFTLTFSVPSDVLGPNPLPSGISGDIGVTFTYTDLTTPSLSLTSQTCTPSAAATMFELLHAQSGGTFRPSVYGFERKSLHVRASRRRMFHHAGSCELRRLH